LVNCAGLSSCCPVEPGVVVLVAVFLLDVDRWLRPVFLRRQRFTVATEAVQMKRAGAAAGV